MLGVAVVVLLLLTGVLGGSSDDPGSADDVVQKVAAAIEQPGKVYHVKGNDGSEVWIDPQAQQFRRKDASAAGELTSIGAGWNRTSFDPLNNTTKDEDTSPKGDLRPRIDNPMVRWTDALLALGFGQQMQLVGRTISDGREVIAIQVESPVVDDSGNTTSTLFGRVEVDPVTYLPYSFQQRQVLPDGTTATPAVAGVDPDRRIVYTTSELIDRSSLPDNFFDPSIVSQQVLTNEESLQRIRQIGLTPLWLGEDYPGSGGDLKVPPTEGIFAVASTNSAEIHYALVGDTIVGKDAVIVRLAKDASTFTPPTIPQYGGNLPEQKDQVTVNGQPATLYSSLLTTADIPCDTGTACPASHAVLYRRLQFTQSGTTVQIEAAARIDDNGADSNGYNSKAGIISLAEALTEVPEASATPTPSG